MKAFVITLALAGLASAATADAQILGARLPTSTRGTSVDGSFHAVGRDGNGNTIYERSTRDRNGNILIQRAVQDGNGNMRIISSRTVSDNSNRNGNNCDNNRSTNTVSDIIFGRSGNVNCDNQGNRVDGSWYQVGRDNNGNTIYERRTRDSNGNVIIQRARRDTFGNMSVFSTRRASNGNGDYQNGRGKSKKDKNNRDNGNDEQNGNYQNGNYDDQNGNQVYRGNDNSNRNNNARGNGRGRGRGNGNGKHGGDN